MTSPVEDFPQLDFAKHTTSQQCSSEEEGTTVGDDASRVQNENERPHTVVKHLRLETSRNPTESLSNMKSPSQTREQAHRLDDDLRILQAERLVEQEATRADEEKVRHELEKTQSRSINRERSRPPETVDEFDVATNPLHERTALYKPPAHPTTAIAKFLKVVHRKSFLVRYFTYITPVVIVILIPLLIGALLPKGQDADVGGVSLLWFSIWLEIVWLTLWAGRILAKALPWPAGVVASLFTDNSKKWRDMVKQLEVSATLFFWLLGCEVSFLPTMKNHHVNGNKTTRPWEMIMNKILISFFVAAVLNFAEKIIIQLIAISFHQRTYEDRIELNKFQIGSLTKCYTFSKAKITVDDSDFEGPGPSGPASGARTPGMYLEKAQKGTKEVFNKFGDVAGKIAGDFTGRAVRQSSHPSQVILALLNSTGGSQVLARRLYRTFAREETETIHEADLRHAFETDDECDAAFTMFDKDLNGDISMEELEAVCVEIGRERKAITASLKDLDSVVGKLDDCLTFVVAIIFILVLVSLISTSAQGVLTSAGSTVLALSWLLQATAQEFLQSLIFVFVKHPFDVGDRITIYGNTGAALKGDDYFVKEISLLYTEFKKLEGHVVQAPNSYLNTLFILNQRRSGGLAEAVPMTFKFGTTIEQIDGLRQKLLAFVKEEKREYQGNVLTELRDIVEAHSINLNVIFFFKSSWQNEGLRLQRRNKFICAMMVGMQELGIEGPRMRYPGQKETFPLYMQNIPFSMDNIGRGGTPDNPAGTSLAPVVEVDEEKEAVHDGHSPSRSQTRQDTIDAAELRNQAARPRGESNRSRARADSFFSQPSIQDPSIVKRARGESLAAMGKRLDFSFGMEEQSSADLAGDVYADRVPRTRIPISVSSTSASRGRVSSRERRNSQRSVDGAHTTARAATFGPGALLQRVRTDGARGSLASTHRNRFFSARRSHESERMELGMAGIPENSPPAPMAADPEGTTDLGMQRPGDIQMTQRMDPRSGLVSSVAVRADTSNSGAALAHAVSAGGQPTYLASPLTYGRVRHADGRVETGWGHNGQMRDRGSAPWRRD